MANRAENIFKRYSAALRAFIIKRISSDRESEDMLHDLFYRFIVADGDDSSIDDVSSWLYRVARNMVIDRSRKKREQPMPYMVDDDMGEIALADLLLRDDYTPESELVRSIIRQELILALEALPVEQRRVFELNELQGVPFSEISEATGVSVNTLISRKRYAVEYLRKRLKDIL